MASVRLSLIIRLIHFSVLILLFASALKPTLAQDAVCALADHIRSANTNTAVGFCPAGTSHDIITIAEDITLTEPLPPITGWITIQGGGHTISGDGKYRIFDVNGGSLTIKNLTLTEGAAPTEERGGAIRMRNGGRLNLLESTIRESYAASGGGIAMTSANDRLTVDRSSFIRNESEFGKDGGAILVDAGQVDIRNSRFSQNYGGFFGGAIKSRSQVTVSNTTFDKNTALVGGAVLAVIDGVATMTHVTMVDNRGNKVDGPDAVLRFGGSVILRNSIIANNNKYNDCEGGISESSGNLSLDISCADRAGGDPMLDAAIGQPAYYPLLDGSPAINAADERFCLPTDQNGTPRPHGRGCDIGAIESTSAIAKERNEPDVCPLPDQLVAANRDQAVGNCAAGNGADTIFLTRDFTLEGALPRITSDITIEGNGYTISGQARQHLIFLVDGGKLSLNNLTLTEGKGAIKAVNGGDVYVTNSSFINNVSTGGGGAILIRSSGSELVVNNSRFIGNRTEDSSTDGSGGAILVFGDLGRISNSSFVNNEAQFEGGAIDTANWGRVDISNSAFIGNRAYLGGAINTGNGGQVNISDSAFIGNQAHRGGAVNTANGGPVNISNSTFIGNHAKHGGALSNTGAVTSITHVTMLDNTALIGSAIWTHEINHSVKLRNSIVAGSRRHYTACFGKLIQNIGNLIEDGSCSPMLSGDPRLAEATDSSTYLDLQAGSPAIAAADASFCLDTDQIGRTRPIAGRCDIGAIQSIPVLQALSDCSVTTTHGLNLRDDPNGTIIGAVRIDETLAPFARTQRWYNVEYQGAEGWISAEYVVTDGDCG